MRERTQRFWPQSIALVLMIACGGGCSVKKFAINKLGDSLANTGTTFAGDGDPELVGQALPFALKLIEGLLAESPKHRGLLQAACEGFTQYSYAFVDMQADEAASDSLVRSKLLRARARKLYMRAHGYGMRGLEGSHPGIGKAIDENPQAAMARLRKRDVPTLYWTAASYGLAIAASKDDPEMIAQLPVVEALINRVVELDESWKDGSVPEFLISLEASKSGSTVSQDDAVKHMRQYFERSVALSKGMRASAFVSYASNASVQAQNRAEFRSLLEKALAIDPDAQPENRLANTIAQRRARWLLDHIDEFFLEEEKPKTEGGKPN